MPKVSIIIPVYNTSQYLRECLISICNQSYTDWECLLVDDGSTDKSGDICDEYAEKDSRFKALHIKNGGASCARNYGISKARGEWIAFVDSDDKVLPDYLKNLIIASESNRTDVVLSNYGGRQKDMHIKENCRLEGVQMVDYFLKNKIFALSAPYGKLYKRSIILDHNIQYPQGIHMGEDMVFMINYMNHVDSASLITDSSYIVNRVEGSLSTRYYSFESEYKCFELWKNGVEKYISRRDYDTTEKDALIWKNRTAATLFRYFESMYKGGQRLTICNSIKQMRKLPYDYFEKLGKYYAPIPFSAKFKIWLLSKHQYFIYNILGRTLQLIGK